MDFALEPNSSEQLNFELPSRVASVEVFGQTPFRENTTKNVENEYNKEFFVGTFNTRSLNSEVHMIHLENALTNIKWDIIGLSEVRRYGEDIIELESGHIFFIYWENKRFIWSGLFDKQKVEKTNIRIQTCFRENNYFENSN